MTTLLLGLAFNLVVFVVLLWAVFAVFEINKRTKALEQRLIDLQGDVSEIKQKLAATGGDATRQANREA